MAGEPRWITAAEVAQVDLPPGGTTGQVLAKSSNVDRVVAWVDPSGGGGSFLSANTARVDPSGNDGTGEVGDLSKPFLTVQAALDALILTGTNKYVVYIGYNAFSEHLLIEGLEDDFFLTFIGVMRPIGFATNASRAFADLTINQVAESNITCNLSLINCNCGGAINSGCYDTNITLDNVRVTSGISATLDGASSLVVRSNTYAEIGGASADWTGDVSIFGVQPISNAIITANGEGTTIKMVDCGPRFDQTSYTNLFSVQGSAVGGVLRATRAVLKDISVASIEFVDSCATGTITADDVSYNNVILPNTYDFAYDFSVDGGSTDGILLRRLGANQLPNGFVITGATLQIITPLDSGTDMATAELTTLQAANDIQTAAVVSGAPWSSTGLKSLTPLTKMTAARDVYLQPAVENLTAGKFLLHISGYKAR